MDEDLPDEEQALVAVLYEPGRRPSIADVRRAAEASAAFAITHEADAANGWAELLVTGLAFDVNGLTPGHSATVAPLAHRFALADEWPAEPLEAIILRPGPHLAGAAAMLPVVRGCVALASALAWHTGAVAVVWIPARSAMETSYFGQVVDDWLDGGAFPALGLTALAPSNDGLVSEGLAFFTGQEIEVLVADRAAAGRIAVRMIHALVGQPPLVLPIEFAGPDGEELLAEPLGNGARVRVGPRP